MAKQKKDPTKSKIGGISLYLSIVALFILSVNNLFNLVVICVTAPIGHFVQFFLGVLSGSALALLLGQGRLAVFMHESKHAFVSFLAGNKYKKMKIGPETGSYEYSYTKRTAHLNAMITLAPYWFPLVTLPCLIIGMFPGSDPLTFRLIVGAAYGLDLVVGVRDLHPHQSDLIRIRGGQGVALTYIALCHLVAGTILVAWAAQGLLGLKLLAVGLWRTALGLVSYYQK